MNKTSIFIIEDMIRSFWFALPLIPMGDPDGWGGLFYFILSIPVCILLLVLKSIRFKEFKTILVFADLFIFMLCLLITFHFTHTMNWHLWGFRLVMLTVLILGFVVSNTLSNKCNSQ